MVIQNKICVMQTYFVIFIKKSLLVAVMNIKMKSGMFIQEYFPKYFCFFATDSLFC